MTDIVSSKKKIQIEETQYRSSISEAALQKMGASTNYLIDKTDTNTTNISTNASGISTNVTNIGTNVTNIASNAGDIVLNENKIIGSSITRTLLAGDTISFQTYPNRYIVRTLANSDLPSNHFYITPQATGYIVIRNEYGSDFNQIQYRVGGGSWSAVITEANLLSFDSTKVSLSSGTPNTTPTTVKEYYFDGSTVAGSSVEFYISSSIGSIPVTIRHVDFLTLLN